MQTDSQAAQILAIAFRKSVGDAACLELEKWLIYTLEQSLGYYADLQLVDHAVPANRLMVRGDLPEDEQELELMKMGAQFQCPYILTGAMTQRAAADGSLEAIDITLELYDVSTYRYALRVDYAFKAFTRTAAGTHQLALRWEGLRDFLYWAIMQIAGAAKAENAIHVWRRIEKSFFVSDPYQLQRLAQIHYINSNEGLPQKLSLLTSLIKDHPGLFAAYMEMGHAQKRMRNYANAMSAYEWAYQAMRELTPRQRAMCAGDIGMCQSLLEDGEQAVHWWKTAIHEDPTYLNPYLNLAHVMEQANNLVEAEHYYVLAGQVAPDDSRVCFNLARLYSKNEEWDKAITQYERQVVSEPDNPWVYSNMANCYLQTGNIPKATAFLVKTVELDPEGEAGGYAHFILTGLQGSFDPV